MTMQAIYDWIDANADECIKDLQTFVQQPSISAQNIGLRECATLIRDMMRRDGLPADFHELDQGPPVVFGHLKAAKPAKTILCYAHYDVQPPEPIEAWSHGGPWSAAIVDGVLYGRGATDNKSGVLAFTKAAKAFMAVRGEVPANLKFMIEGEEEIGSPNLAAWAEKNKELLAADGMHCLDGTIETGTDVPDVSLGLKSVLFVELIARGANRDIHSLNFPLVPAPVWDLIRALNTIMDENRRILIEDWYDGLWQLGPDDEQQLVDKAGRVDLAGMKEEWGISEFALGRDGIDAIRARSYEPTANIQGIIAGYTGPGTKTIVPNEARARLDFRLIPNIQARCRDPSAEGASDQARLWRYRGQGVRRGGTALQDQRQRRHQSGHHRRRDRGLWRIAYRQRRVGRRRDPATCVDSLRADRLCQPWRKPACAG